MGIVKLLQWSQAGTARLFHQFGIHCATHQIRLILISGLVITSLFYPALAIYSSSSPQPLTHFSPFLDIFFGSDYRYAVRDDLQNVWSLHDVLRVREDPVALTRCGQHRTIRIERILLGTRNLDLGAVNEENLLSAIELERQLDVALSHHQSSCVKSRQGACIVFSPLEFWSHDPRKVELDKNPMLTLNARKNISVAGIPITPDMTLSGKEYSDTSLDYAWFLALTYLFHEDDCLSFEGHRDWIHLLEKLFSDSYHITPNNQEPLLLALEYDPGLRNASRISVITVILYLSYIIFFIFFSGSMRRMDTLHSRVGLCFTGLVEILVSTITSLSVCALGGLRITMVPWGILPIVIVFVGAENMFRLIDEVVKTPITLPVKERIGVGLGKAGTSNTIRVVTYNTIIGVIAFFSSGAIHQFCVFAIVVLVAHWFLIHTFFVAVLSIDIQRLELDDLLRQNTSLNPISGHLGPPKHGGKSTRSESPLGSFLRSLVKSRVRTNVSLLLLLVITGTLYYTTLPGSLREPIAGMDRASMLRSRVSDTASEKITGAWHLWNLLNPEGDTLVHLRVEAPTILRMRVHHNSPSNSHISPKRTFQTLRPILWLFKIMILPIGLTLGTLYLILLYLLKDAELLEAQRNRLGPGEEKKPEPVEGGVSFNTIPRVFSKDIGFLAASSDAATIPCGDLDGNLKVWIASRNTYLPLDLSSLSAFDDLSSACSITCVAVDSSGHYCAVGWRSGEVTICLVTDIAVESVQHLTPPSPTSMPTYMEFVIHNAQHRSDTQSDCPDLLVTYKNGTILHWPNPHGSDHPNILHPPSESVVNMTSIVQVVDPVKVLVIISTNDGAVEAHELLTDGSGFGLRFTVRLNHKAIHVHACVVEIEETPRTMFAIGTSNGTVSLWDGLSGDCIYTVHDIEGPINRLRLLRAVAKPCLQCGELPLCCFLVAFSVGHIVSVKYVSSSRRCSCQTSLLPISNGQIHRSPVTARRPRTGSSTSNPPSRPLSRRSSLSFENSPALTFPVSGHGAHSRRGSDTPRRNPDLNYELDNMLFSLKTSSESNSIWSNLRVVQYADALCERGGWDVIGHRIVGLRRKSRSGDDTCRDNQLVNPNTYSQHLTHSVLDRWEIWILDYSKSNKSFQASSLLNLPPSKTFEIREGEASENDIEIARLPFTRLSPVIVSVSHCIAGFGNTVGIISFPPS